MSQFLLIKKEEFEVLSQKVDLLIELSKDAGNIIKMNDWICELEAQKLLGLKETSMWSLRKKKQLVFSKIGSKTFYSIKSIEKLLSKNEK